MKYWTWVIGRMKRKLWWQAVLYGLLGVATALAATGAERWLTWQLPFDVSREAVDSLLSIISSSMLAVTTFSLGAMTAAFSGAANGVTPRAVTLLMEDRVTHNVLSSFIGAFVFSIVSTIVLKTGSYGEPGRAVLFVITVAVIGLIVIQLLRWINHLILLGRLNNTVDQVEEATREALTHRLVSPYLGCHPWRKATPRPKGATPVCGTEVGYVQFINYEALSKLCGQYGLEAWLPLPTGSFCYQGTELVWLEGVISDELIDKARSHFVIASNRSFEQDPRFGLAVLAEVGMRALSPGINDPGTALDVIARQTRLLTLWSQGRDTAEVEYPRLHMVPLSDADLFEDAFMLLARDGAHMIEIQLRLQKSLQALQTLGSPVFKAAAHAQARSAAERALDGMKAPCDLRRLLKVLEAGPRTPPKGRAVQNPRPKRA